MMGSCIVYGGRQLGKSALLRAAARKFNDAEHRVAIYQSIYKVGKGAIPADKIWMTLWPRLAERGIAPQDMSSGNIAAARSGTLPTGSARSLAGNCFCCWTSPTSSLTRTLRKASLPTSTRSAN